MASIFSLFGEIFVENKDAIDKMTQTDKKGKDTAVSLGDAFSTAATAVGAVATAMAGIVTATVAAAKETASAGDTIDKMSQKIGMSREAYQKWEYVLSQNGTDISVLQSGMKTLTNAFDDASAGTSSAVEKFERLGLSVEDLSTMSREDIFATVVESLQGVEDETERAAIANDLLGKSATELMPLLNGDAESTAALMEQAEEYGMIMSDEAVTASAAFTDSLDNLTRSFEGTKNNMMGQFLPALTQVTDGLTLLLNGDTSGIDSITDGITGFLDELETMIPVVLELGGSIVMTIAQAIIDNLPQLATTAFSLISQLVSFVIENLPAIIEAGMTILMELMNGIAASLPEMIPTIITVILTIVENLIDNADLLIDGAISLVMGLAKGIISAIPILIEKAPVLVQKLCDAVVENAPKLLEAAGELIVMIVQGITDNLQKITNAAGDIVNSLKHGMSKLWTKLKNIGKDVIKKVWEGLKEAWKDVTEWFTGVWDKLFGDREVNVSANTTTNGGDGQHAGGLDYVPYDGYQATLHKGERVLTAAQVRQGYGATDGVTIVQNIQAVAQTPVELAALTEAYFTKARWAI